MVARLSGVVTVGALLLGAAAGGVVGQEVIEKAYCGVGAGPAGVQLGFFWHTSKRDYVILEKADGPGSFFRCVQAETMGTTMHGFASVLSDLADLDRAGSTRGTAT